MFLSAIVMMKNRRASESVHFLLILWGKKSVGINKQQLELNATSSRVYVLFVFPRQ